MFDRVYRQRLEADLAQWETDGVITPAARIAISGALPPLTSGISIPVVVAIVGGLLIAAAFLAFVAAHWTDFARLLRFAILVAGIIAANSIGAWFARSNRPVLADLCASVGAIIFGAGIALVGQMYHLSGDFAAGVLLWAAGALVTAALTGSRGALAVALVAGSIWSVMRVVDAYSFSGALAVPHLPFVAFWLVSASLAIAWNSRVAAHLVALATFPWWIMAAVQISDASHKEVLFLFVLANGATLFFGGGLALAAVPRQRARDAGMVLSIYGALSLAGIAILEMIMASVVSMSAAATVQPRWVVSFGVAGAILAFATSAMTRQAGAFFAGLAIALILFVATIWTAPQMGQPWPIYLVGLCAMLSLVVSGMLHASRPRVVAGWFGIAGAITTITWALKGSLLYRSAFLAAAGIVAIVLAMVLNRLLPRADR